MKIKYGELEFYSRWLLDNLSLAGKKSRMRMKFLEQLANHQRDFIKYQNDLIREHARLDEEGKPIVLDPDEKGIGKPDIIDWKAYEEDYKELAYEEVVIEENDSNREMLTTIKECVDNCPIEWQGQKAIEYEAVCKLFDNIYSENQL